MEKSLSNGGGPNSGWNEISDDLRNSNSYNIFKSHYKAYLIENDPTEEDDFLNTIF